MYVYAHTYSGVLLFLGSILPVMWICFISRLKSRKAAAELPHSQIPTVSKDIREVEDEPLPLSNSFAGREPDKVVGGEISSQSGSFHQLEKDAGSQSGEDSSSGTVGVYKPSASHYFTAPSPLSGLPEFSHLGWGYWFTLRDLEFSTNQFSKENVVGEGGYGVVYRGQLINGTPVAVKRLLNNL